MIVSNGQNSLEIELLVAGMTSPVGSKFRFTICNERDEVIDRYSALAEGFTATEVLVVPVSSLT
jgi:hypothetical protein